MVTLMWPDVESALIADCDLMLASAEISALPTSTDRPAGLNGNRFVQIQAVTGTDDGLTDRALVDIDCFAPDRDQARDLAERVRSWMGGLPGKLAGGVLIDAVATSVRPHWLDFKNPAIQRFAASYRVSTRLVEG